MFKYMHMHIVHSFAIAVAVPYQGGSNGRMEETGGNEVHVHVGSRKGSRKRG